MGNISTLLIVVFTGLICLAGCQQSKSGNIKNGQNGQNGQNGSGIIAIVEKNVCLDQSTRLMWQIKRSRKKITSPALSKSYVQQLTTGNYSDWRIPTIKEFYPLCGSNDYKYHKNPKNTARVLAVRDVGAEVK